jgi:hypothetical protein
MAALVTVTIRLREDTILRADALIPFVNQDEDWRRHNGGQAKRSDVQRIALEIGLTELERLAGIQGGR